MFLTVGAVVAIGYSALAKTALSREFVFTVIMMTVIPKAVNLYFTTTYRVLLQTQQKEYVISTITAVTIGLGHIMNIVAIMIGCEMWMVRFITMCFGVFNSVLITIIA